LLLELAHAHGHECPNGWIRIQVPLSQHEIADLITASREGVNRAMVQLRREGRIKKMDGWLAGASLYQSKLLDDLF
jgi:hypothetical protein